MAQRRLSYNRAGVDISANELMVQRIAHSLRRTYGPRVIDRHRGFAGLFRLDYNETLFRKNFRKPILVGCADGVGTKVLVAARLKRFDTVGIDLVAMSVNDLVTTGAEPLFFLDYLGLGRLDPERAANLVDGVARGCELAGCALLGGETAEMPDIYQRGEFDMVGFAVGVAEERRLIDAKRVSAGDVLIGLASNGIHSNGYTLVRKLFFEREKMSPDRHVEELGCNLGDELLKPTRIYVRPVLSVLSKYRRKRVVTGMAHITGGGLPGNVARILPGDCDAVIRLSRWKVPPVFKLMVRLGVSRAEMYRVFNMGIGFVLAVRPTFAGAIVERFRRLGETPYKLGYVRRGTGRVELR